MASGANHYPSKAAPAPVGIQSVFSAILPLVPMILAQGAQANEGPGLLSALMPMVAILVVFYFLMLRPQRQRDMKFRQMVENLKENDHVVTSGGMHGVVTNVQRDAQRATLRIDDTNNTKVRIDLWSISRVVGDEINTDAKKADAKSKS